MNNQTAITQAAFDGSFGVGVSGAVLGAGQMSPQAADVFLDYVVDATSLKGACRQIRMDAPERIVPKIGIGRQILRPGTAGVSPGVTAQATVDNVVLQAQEFVGMIKIHDNELEDSLEGDITDHIMRMIAIELGNQLEDAFMIGNKTGVGAVKPQDIRQQMNGWITLAQSGGHVIDGSTLGDGQAGANTPYISAGKLSKISKTVPDKYKVQKTMFRYYVPDGIYMDYWDLVAGRLTPGGDVAYMAPGYESQLPNGASVLGYHGYPIWPVPLFPTSVFSPKTAGLVTPLSVVANAGDTQVTLTSVTGLAIGDAIQIGISSAQALYEVRTVTGIAGNVVSFDPSSPLLYQHAVTTNSATQGTSVGTGILFTHALNLIFGIMRDVRIEPQRWAPERATYITVSMRADVQIENTDAVVYCQNCQIV